MLKVLAAKPVDLSLILATYMSWKKRFDSYKLFSHHHRASKRKGVIKRRKKKKRVGKKRGGGEGREE